MNAATWIQMIIIPKENKDVCMKLKVCAGLMYLLVSSTNTILLMSLVYALADSPCLQCFGYDIDICDIS